MKKTEEQLTQSHSGRMWYVQSLVAIILLMLIETPSSGQYSSDGEHLIFTTRK